MSFFADTDALKWACCKVVIRRHCAVECEINCGFHLLIGVVGVTEFYEGL